jgi:hypothetical protein
MVLVLDVLLIHPIRKHSFRPEPPTEEPDKLALELRRKVGDLPAGVLADDEHLPQVRLGLRVAFESVLVATLFLTDLAVPS